MSAKNTIREIKKATKKRFTDEQKIQIVLEGGKNGLTFDTKRNATSDEVKNFREENADLRRAASEQMLENIRL